MTARQTSPTLILAVAVLALSAVTARAEPSVPDEAAICAGCHGERGVSANPLVPTLAGQPYTLIEDNLLAFRAGGRACSANRDDGSPPALLARTMCDAVGELSNAEIADLAAYFERQSFQPADQPFDAELAERGRTLHQEKGCEGCHSDGGHTTNDLAPVLAGQWTPYLRRAMESLRSGERQGPKVMNAAIHQLGDREVEALLNYYAGGRE